MVQFGRQGAFLQEEHNFYIDQQGIALLRLFYLRVGQRLVEMGLINSPDDIFYLELDQIHEVLANLQDTSAALRVRHLVRRHREELALAATLTPPPFLGEAPAGPPPMSNPMERGMVRFFGGPPQGEPVEGQLKGNPGSKGVVSGVARVARSLDEATALEPGEVLIAITTMPAWTPLFGIAAAVVTETGGALSHCAIVAREYGIPAVVGARGATKAITTGTRVTVDGGTGVVTIDE
jgi:pyruvate,water dikinase